MSAASPLVPPAANNGAAPTTTTTHTTTTTITTMNGGNVLPPLPMINSMMQQFQPNAQFQSQPLSNSVRSQGGASGGAGGEDDSGDEVVEGDDGDEYEDDDGPIGLTGEMLIGLPRKKKRRLTEEQIHELSKARDLRGVTGKKLHTSQRLQVAAEIGLPESAVRNWLNNHKRKRGNANGNNNNNNRNGMLPGSAGFNPMGQYSNMNLSSMPMNGMMGIDPWSNQVVSMVPPPQPQSNLTNFFLSQPQQFQSSPYAQPNMSYGLPPQNTYTPMPPTNYLQQQQQQQQALRSHMDEIQQQSFMNQWGNQSQMMNQPPTSVAQPPLPLPTTTQPIENTSPDKPYDANSIKALQARLAARQASLYTDSVAQQSAAAEAQQAEILSKILEIQRYNQVAVEAELNGAATLGNGHSQPAPMHSTNSSQASTLVEGSPPTQFHSVRRDSTFGDLGAGGDMTNHAASTIVRELDGDKITRDQIKALQRKLTEAFQKYHERAQKDESGTNQVQSADATLPPLPVSTAPTLQPPPTQPSSATSQLPATITTPQFSHLPILPVPTDPFSSGFNSIAGSPAIQPQLSSQSVPASDLLNIFDKDLLDSYYQQDILNQATLGGTTTA